MPFEEKSHMFHPMGSCHVTSWNLPKKGGFPELRQGSQNGPMT